MTGDERTIDVIEGLIEREAGTKFLEPLITMEEDKDEIVLTVDLPFVRKEDIQVFATGRSLEIRAKIFRNLSFEGRGSVQREIKFNFFRHSLSLSEEVDPDEARAKFTRGILIIRLPKKTVHRQIRIE